MPSKFPTQTPVPEWTARHVAALLLANLMMAVGPFLVRLADTGPVAAGFWRLILALPVLGALTLRERRGAVKGIGYATLMLILGGGVFFGIDLASWHIGIERTKLGNATLFGNAGSLILMIWGLVSARRTPRLPELVAIAAALIGAALLMRGSLEISQAHLIGDLLCLFAGLCYVFYILMLNAARARMGQFAVLTTSMLSSIPLVLAIALWRGEAIWPHDWTPLLALALSSQVVGQGLLIFALRHFTPLVIGLALLTQPAVSAAIGWLAFHEVLSLGDIAGMVLLAAALVLARLGDRGNEPGPARGQITPKTAP